MRRCVRVRMFLRQPNGWADRTKLDIRIYIDPGIVLGKSRPRSGSRSRSVHRRRKNGGVLGAERDKSGANAVGISIEQRRGERGQGRSAVCVTMEVP